MGFEGVGSGVGGGCWDLVGWDLDVGSVVVLWWGREIDFGYESSALNSRCFVARCFVVFRFGSALNSRCFELLISCLRVELFPEAAVVAVQPSIAVPPLGPWLVELFSLTCILSRILFYSISAQQDPSTS